MYNPFQTSRPGPSNDTTAQTERRTPLMKTKILVSLTALPMLLSALTLAPVSAAGVPAAPTSAIQATMHGTSLALRGENFTPGSSVRIAVIDARSWHVVTTANVKAEAATYNCTGSVFCGQPDPAAGRLDARITVHAGTTSLLHLLYRSGSNVGFMKIDRR